VERTTEAADEYADLHNPLTQFYFWNRTRRMIGLYTFAMLGHYAEVHAPYLSEELITFLLSVPPEHLFSKTLHQEVIAETYPAFADIPYSIAGTRRKRSRMAGLPFIYQHARSSQNSATRANFIELLILVAAAIQLGEVPRTARQVLNHMQMTHFVCQSRSLSGKGPGSH
jgi:hypothetical protein